MKYHLIPVRMAIMKRSTNKRSLVSQWAKDPALSLQWPRLLLCCGAEFDPWPRNFHIHPLSTAPPPKKKKKQLQKNPQ